MVVNDSKGSCVEENNDKNHTSLPITTKWGLIALLTATKKMSKTLRRSTRQRIKYSISMIPKCL
jgi:hypothetical protein